MRLFNIEIHSVTCAMYLMSVVQCPFKAKIKFKKKSKRASSGMRRLYNNHCLALMNIFQKAAKYLVP